MRKVYDSKAFHWSYIFNATLLPMVILAWVEAKINKYDPKPFRKAIKAALFNKHTCEFCDEVVEDEYRKCKNVLCNIVTIRYADGTWISPIMRRLEKDKTNETN